MPKFNTGKFNIKASGFTSVIGSGLAAIEAACTVNVDRHGSVAADVMIHAETQAVLEKRATATVAMMLDSYGIATIEVPSGPVDAGIIIEAQASAAMLGEEYLEITGLALAPGESVEIDMCNLTVTKDGQNALHLVSQNSDFFDFLPGSNDIEVVADGAAGGFIEAYWKDRWL